MSDNETLLFFHGWGTDETIWETFITEHFSAYETHTVKMPVFGSKQMGEDVTELEEVCEQLKDDLPEQSVIVAWSLGAHVAIKFAELYPQRCRRLILLAANPCFVRQNNWPYGVDDVQLKKMIGQLEDSKEETLNRFYTLMTVGTDKQKNIIRQLKSFNYTGGLSKHGLRFGLELLLQQDLRNTLVGLTMPISMCFGEHDALINRNICDDPLFDSQRIKTQLIDRADHIPFISNPEQTAEAIMQNLA